MLVKNDLRILEQNGIAVIVDYVVTIVGQEPEHSEPDNVDLGEGARHLRHGVDDASRAHKQRGEPSPQEEPVERLVQRETEDVVQWWISDEVGREEPVDDDVLVLLGGRDERHLSARHRAEEGLQLGYPVGAQEEMVWLGEARLGKVKRGADFKVRCGPGEAGGFDDKRWLFVHQWHLGWWCQVVRQWLSLSVLGILVVTVVFWPVIAIIVVLHQNNVC